MACSPLSLEESPVGITSCPDMSVLSLGVTLDMIIGDSPVGMNTESDDSTSTSTPSPYTATSSPGVIPLNEKTTSSYTKRKTWVRDYALPPCRVCGRDGSGLHYGVNTCSPCKGFFQRSFVHQHKYVCRGDHRCQLLKSRGSVCSYCRLKKCLEVGMSKDGIQHGRCRLDKKLKDIKEVKELQASQALTVMLVQEERKRPSVEKLVMCIWNNRTKYSNVCDAYEVKLSEMDQQHYSQLDVDQCVLDDYIRQFSNEDESHMVGLSQYYDILEIVSRRLIKFAKSIPGFRDLPLEDQTTLLQDSHADSRLVNCMGMFYLMVAGYSDLEKVLNDSFGRYCYSVCQRFTNLELTTEETAVLMAFVLFNGDTSRLTEPRSVEAIHSQLLDALQLLLKRNHPNDKLIFPKIIDILIGIRTFAKFDEDFRMGACQLMEAGAVRLPRLIRELTPQTANNVDLTCIFSNFCKRYMP